MLLRIVYFQIVDEDGKELGPNVEGEFALRVKPNRPVGLFLRYVVTFYFTFFCLGLIKAVKCSD